MFPPETSDPVRTLFTDSHAHLSLVAARLGEAVLEKVLTAYAASKTGAFILDIGTEPGDLEPRLERLGNRPYIKFSAGIWPGKAAFDDPPRALEALSADLETGFCSALGECGLDYHHMEAEPSVQVAFFEAQALIAVESGLPLVVHSRDAFLDTLSVVAEIAGAIPVVIHSFGYGPSEAERFLAAGCYLSFAGNLTYKNSTPLREALKLAPENRILFETDSPYMNPLPIQGKPSGGRLSTSLDLNRTIETASVIKGKDVGS
ncbi:MAG: TatD family hydrolase, partial [Spirochaetes bacterium]|nr:TatD family hydrolase [Spirochaetota bacterium]